MEARTTKILNIVYGLTVLLFLLDNLTSFDIKNQAIKSFVYYGILIETPLTLIWNALALRTRNRKIIGAILPALILTVILIVGPVKILFSSGSWKTHAVLYKNEHLSFKTIETQRQDIGALGHNQRTVEVFNLTPFFIIISDVPKEIEKRTEWVKVDKEQ